MLAALILIYLSPFLAWMISLAVFYFAWPYVRASRRGIVVMAVLCLSPSVGFPAPAFWPLVVALPFQIVLGQPFIEVLPITLGATLAIGGVAWYLSGRIAK